MDADAILAVKREAISALPGTQYTDEQLAAWAPDDDALSAFESAVESDQFTVLLAEVRDEIVAYGVLNGPEERIDAVYVRPEYARRGIATSLVRQLEMRARMQGIEGLSIIASLNARPFYESLGYWTFGTKVRTIDGVDIEFAVMHRRLVAD
ncbi:GNAT family N-acetyltransferase [Salinibaculum salinum]|uniref:GNAT family N-acetyltransferase n=1 Tax=Salinibaculum salinum TaxID=3131996 RepID=UPI0030EC7196